MKIKIFSRFNVTLILIAVQVLLYVFLMRRFVNLLPFITIISSWLSIIAILWLIKRDEAASVRISWMLVVIMLPITGVLLFFLFGNSYLSRKIKKRLSQENSTTATLVQNECNIKDSRAEGCLKYLTRATPYPAYVNAETKYYPLGKLMFADMLEELATAKRFIFLEYFIIEAGDMWNELLAVLLEKAEEGIDVRLIFDDLGSQQLFTGKYERYLREKGIKTVRFNPLSPRFHPFMNNRDHRKIMIIDGRVGFTGAVNIVDESIKACDTFGVWKDTGIRITGDAVWSFTLMFKEIWNCFCKPEEIMRDYASYESEGTNVSDGIVIPYGDSPFLSERIGENVYIDILNQATDYVYIFTPFLIISEKMIYALQMAAKRGVDVRIVLPGRYDWTRAIVQRVSRSYYKYLLKDGIKIYESPTGYMHAKNFVCDDEIGVVGTINLDYRSLYLHFECATLLYKTGAIKDMKDDALKTFADGNEVTQGRIWFGSYVLDAIIHLFAPAL